MSFHSILKVTIQSYRLILFVLHLLCIISHGETCKCWTMKRSNIPMWFIVTPDFSDANLLCQIVKYDDNWKHCVSFHYLSCKHNWSRHDISTPFLEVHSQLAWPRLWPWPVKVKQPPGAIRPQKPFSTSLLWHGQCVSSSNHRNSNYHGFELIDLHQTVPSH